jgi:hypothetical protein
MAHNEKDPRRPRGPSQVDQLRGDRREDDTGADGDQHPVLTATPEENAEEQLGVAPVLPGPTSAARPKGPGGKFFVVDKAMWLTAATSGGDLSDIALLNRMVAYLVLACGTGVDNVHTSWAARSVETYTGVGRQHAQAAIDSLVNDVGVIAHAQDHTRFHPRYLMARIETADPIFIPNALVVGLAGETPILRRVRQTGDPLVLRLLIDLYGAVQPDVTYGVPLGVLRRGHMPDDPDACRKAFERGIHTVWELDDGHSHTFGPEAAMRAPHAAKVNGQSEDGFWRRVGLLERIGALTFEAWVFDGAGDNAEPLFPLDEIADLASEAARALWPGRDPTNEFDGRLIPLPAHFAPPRIQHVAILRPSVDARGARMAFAKRMEAIERWTAIYAALASQADNQMYDQPMRMTS